MELRYYQKKINLSEGNMSEVLDAPVGAPAEQAWQHPPEKKKKKTPTDYIIQIGINDIINRNKNDRRTPTNIYADIIGIIKKSWSVYILVKT